MILFIWYIIVTMFLHALYVCIKMRIYYLVIFGFAYNKGFLVSLVEQNRGNIKTFDKMYR